MVIVPRMTDDDVAYIKRMREIFIGQNVMWPGRVDTFLTRNDTCKIIYFTRTKDSIYSLQWSKPYVHMIAPTDVYFFMNGKYIMTINNFITLNYPEIALYTMDGLLLKKYSLEDFLSAKKISEMGHDVGFNGWVRNYTVDEDKMEFNFIIKLLKSGFWRSKLIDDTLSLNLETGKLIERSLRIEKK
jgi:hypothetical protein